MNLLCGLSSPGLLFMDNGLDDHGCGVDPGKRHEQGKGPRNGNDEPEIMTSCHHYTVDPGQRHEQGKGPRSDNDEPEIMTS